jgi:hypothetical protein
MLDRYRIVKVPGEQFRWSSPKLLRQLQFQRGGLGGASITTGWSTRVGDRHIEALRQIKEKQ